MPRAAHKNSLAFSALLRARADFLNFHGDTPCPWAKAWNAPQCHRNVFVTCNAPVHPLRRYIHTPMPQFQRLHGNSWQWCNQDRINTKYKQQTDINHPIRAAPLYYYVQTLNSSQSTGQNARTWNSFMKILTHVHSIGRHTHVIFWIARSVCVPSVSPSFPVDPIDCTT